MALEHVHALTNMEVVGLLVGHLVVNGVDAGNAMVLGDLLTFEEVSCHERSTSKSPGH